MKGQVNWTGIFGLTVALALGTMYLKPWESSSPVGPSVPVSVEAQAVAKSVNESGDRQYFASCFDALGNRIEATEVVKDWEAFKRLNKQFGDQMTAKKTKGKYPDFPASLTKFWDAEQKASPTFDRSKVAVSCRSLATALRKAR